MSDRSTHDATERNIDLAFAFIRETLEDPATLDGVLDGVTFVLVPADDPQLAESNISLASKLCVTAEMCISNTS